MSTRLIREVPGVQAANWNGPAQTVIAGPAAAVDQALDLAARRGISGRLLPVSSAFHTPLVASARRAVRASRRAPAQPVSPTAPCTPISTRPPTLLFPAAIAARLGDHLACPVRFGEMIEAMYRDGARVFVEVGPGRVLTPLVGSVLGDRPHLAVAAQPPGPGGLAGWLDTVARLAVAGIPLRLERLTRDRVARALDLQNLPSREDAEPTTASTWLVNGSRARPINEPEISRLGQGAILESPRRHRRSDRAAAASSPAVAAGKSPATSQSSRRARGRRDRTPQRRCCEVSTLPARPKRQWRIAHSHETSTRSNRRTAIRSSSRFSRRCRCSSKSSDRRCSPTCPGAAPPHLLRRRASHPNSRIGLATTRQPHRPPPHANAAMPPRNERATERGTTIIKFRNTRRRLRRSTSRMPRRMENHTSPMLPRRQSPSWTAPRSPSRLLETVRDRTGYPIETLGLDLDMEADLGIDSIKRVEILGKMRDEFPVLKGLSDSAEAMDALARARTLGVIVDRMTSPRGKGERPVRAGDTAVSPGSRRADHRLATASRTN